jgi:hypothetical protein
VIQEIDLHGEAGVFEGMVEVTAVDENADAIHGERPYENWRLRATARG